jgi:FKBP-type peptidyl-prolyl cis-trans isomerase
MLNIAMKKNKLFPYSLFLIILCIVTSCQKHTSAIEGYTRSDDGFYFKLLALGDGNDHPLPNQVLVVDAVMKTLTDSVFWDTKHDAQNGLYIVLSTNELMHSCNPYFLNLVEGDSASFYINPKVFFRNYFDTVVPSFCTKDTLVKLDIKLNQIISKGEYIALKKMMEYRDAEDVELEELKKIEAYVSKKYPSADLDCDGIYTLQKEKTNYQPIALGKRIKIEYEGFFLDGKSIDNTKQELEFTYGTPDQLIKGLNIVIATLKKGEFVKIIVPSRLAFGEKGSSNGSIQPYTPLVYNLKIIDIK